MLNKFSNNVYVLSVHIIGFYRFSSADLYCSHKVAVEDVASKVLSEPIRPHFAIASIGPSFDLQEAHQLEIIALGSQVPVISNCPCGIIGRDAFYDEFKEILWEFTEEEDDDDPEPLILSESLMLVVGFLPELKEPRIVMIDKFVTDIREFSTSASGCKSPAARPINIPHCKKRSVT
ncbi:hypothetical protein L1987_22890 [Smallanthus sonchifolius]|uniref:Uncharacterized protein n=1 Tax=Smallanthus sonchifolius TaxID=185202 RepID=A0ACB9IG28_9ASTR|nr:hypothetical protein L1987_22890 [Smallanthus sonchifolius]